MKYGNTMNSSKANKLYLYPPVKEANGLNEKNDYSRTVVFC